MNIDSIRNEYNSGELKDSEMDNNPWKQFTRWLEDAIRSGAKEPTAMTLSTAGTDGFPQSRTVLLKYTDETGFTFFTNYASSKAMELGGNPRAALHFFWPELHRQVRVTGTIEKTSPRVSDNYFAARPRNSQLGAWASRQSHEATSREEIEWWFHHFDALFSGKEISRPQHWGGYLLKPLRIEFWQGRENRMHDRIVYEKSGDAWKFKRLFP